MKVTNNIFEPSVGNMASRYASYNDAVIISKQVVVNHPNTYAAPTPCAAGGYIISVYTLEESTEDEDNSFLGWLIEE